VEAHTTGFEELSEHVLPFTPAWGADETGLDASQIISFARAYASTRPTMILLGGSSIHKGANGWHAARAISCLPALNGDFGSGPGAPPLARNSTSRSQSVVLVGTVGALQSQCFGRAPPSAS
jgi:anaerobic selenocysteine-containing dehydrogenase